MQMERAVQRLHHVGRLGIDDRHGSIRYSVRHCVHAECYAVFQYCLYYQTVTDNYQRSLQIGAHRDCMVKCLGYAFGKYFSGFTVWRRFSNGRGIVPKAVVALSSPVSEIALVQQSACGQWQSRSFRNVLGGFVRPWHIAGKNRLGCIVGYSLCQQSGLLQATWSELGVEGLEYARCIQECLAVADKDNGHVLSNLFLLFRPE